MDPSSQFYQDSAAILKLTNRALTTFALIDGKSVLVPDPSCVKVAVATSSLPVRANVHVVEVPTQWSLQPLKSQPAFGVAVSVTLPLVAEVV